MQETNIQFKFTAVTGTHGSVVPRGESGVAVDGFGETGGSRESVVSGMGGTTDTSQDSQLQRLKQLDLKIIIP